MKNPIEATLRAVMAVAATRPAYAHVWSSLRPSVPEPESFSSTPHHELALCTALNGIITLPGRSRSRFAWIAAIATQNGLRLEIDADASKGDSELPEDVVAMVGARLPLYDAFALACLSSRLQVTVHDDEPGGLLPAGSYLLLACADHRQLVTRTYNLEYLVVGRGDAKMSSPDIQELIDITKRLVSPASWALPGVEMSAYNSEMIVTQIPDIHAHIEAVLRAWAGLHNRLPPANVAEGGRRDDHSRKPGIRILN